MTVVTKKVAFKIPRLARTPLGVERLDDIAKNHVTHSDRRADDRRQNKIQTTDDR